MTFSLLWLPDVLEEEGLKVAEVDGWQDRGRGDMGPVLGVMCHYTAGPRSGNMPTLRLLVEGRSDLPGPLSQLGLGRDGTYYVIAAGRCNHAGKGVWQGVTNGNSNFIGIEAENTGRANDTPWPDVQLDAYRRGVAAILKHLGRGHEFCCGHREYARPTGRKPDPNLEMSEFRDQVRQLMEGGGERRPLIPPVETGENGRPTLRRGMPADPRWVEELQSRLGVEGPDVFGPKTEAAVRVFQRQRGMVADGIVGPRTWEELDRAATEERPQFLDPPRTPELVPDPAPENPAVAPLAWGAKVSSDFRQRVREISVEIGCTPDDLMACMAFETGETFSPSVRNRHSGATGLIQFMPSTAEWLGTTTSALASMTAVQQLDFVERYFRGRRGIRTLEDLYMAILWPRAVGKPDSELLFAKPSVAYAQNRGLDIDGDGRITKWEASTKVRAKLEAGRASNLLG